MPPKQSANKDTKPSGKDKFIYKNGSKYEGEYATLSQGIVRHGRGIYTEALTNLDPYECPGIEPLEVNATINQVFDGQWNNDQFESGTVTYPDGSRYEGTFDNEGNYAHGKYYFKNGEIWDGPFKACKMNGDGIFTDKAGKQWKCTMVDNQCMAGVEIEE